MQRSEKKGIRSVFFLLHKRLSQNSNHHRRIKFNFKTASKIAVVQERELQKKKNYCGRNGHKTAFYFILWIWRNACHLNIIAIGRIVIFFRHTQTKPQDNGKSLVFKRQVEASVTFYIPIYIFPAITWFNLTNCLLAFCEYPLSRVYLKTNTKFILHPYLKSWFILEKLSWL